MAQTIDVACVKEEQCEAICNMFKNQDWQLTMRHRDLGLVKIEQDMSFVWQSSANASSTDNKQRQAAEKQTVKKWDNFAVE